jgi:hypothetical protein
MKNILKDIELNCQYCKSFADVVEFLHNRGDFSYTSEFYREVWFFYLESISLFDGRKKRSLAKAHTCKMMGISEGTFNRIRRAYR